MGNRLDPKAAEAVMLKAGYKPLEPFVRSHEKWKCIHIVCGDIVYPSYHQIIQGRGGCKPCGYAKNALNSRKSETEAVSIMLKAGLKPLEPFKTLTSKWKCTHIACGRTVFPTCASISRGRGGCVECGRKATSVKTRTTETDAVAVMLKAGLEPLEAYKGATVKWKCKHINCGNIVYPKYNWIQQGQSGCRSCAKVKNGFKRRLSQNKVESFLSTLELQIIGEYKGAENAFQIRCLKCGDISLVLWNNLQKRKGVGCEKCARKASGTISKEVAITDMERKGLLPLEPYTGNRDPWLCKCQVCFENVHISRDSIRRRSAEFKGCIDCAKKAQSEKMVSSNKNKILERFKSKNLILRSEYINSRFPIEVECNKCGYIFTTEGLRIGRQKYGCAKCSGNYIDPTEAEEFMISKGYKTTVPFPGSHLSWDSIHLLCGNAVTPQYSSIKSGSGGCKYCAEYGFQYSKPAYLYLITSERLNAHKIGIANPAKMKKSDRLYRYQHHGWSVIKIWQFQNGRLAEEVENSILLHLRVKLEIPPYLTIGEMSGQGGHTETVDADAITLIKLEKIINKVIKGLQR